MSALPLSVLVAAPAVALALPVLGWALFARPEAVAVSTSGHYVASDSGYYRVRGLGPYPPS